jgi:8-oxo-dGTP pyrophosphatase MutT (NUDIX family)
MHNKYNMEFKNFFALFLENIEDEIRGQRGEHHVGADGNQQFWGNRGAGIVPFCPRTNRFLLAHRSPYVNEPNTWGVFGGKIDGDENPVEAARRELVEELGYTGPMKIRELTIFRHQSFVFHNYIGLVAQEFDDHDLDWETQDAQWFAIDEFPKNLHFGLKYIMADLRRFVQGAV